MDSTTSLTSTTWTDVPRQDSTEYTAVMIVRSATLTVIGIVAVFGNSLVVSVVFKYKKLRTSANVFVCNLSLVGTIIGLMLCINVSNVTENRNTLGSAGCSVWGMMIVCLYVVETNTFALISLSRYFLITRPQAFPRMFSLRHCAVHCGAIWAVGLLMALGTVAGWSEIAFNPKSKACSYSRIIGSSYHYFLISLSFGIPLLTSVVAYALLYAAVRRSAGRARTAPIETSGNSSGNNHSPATNASRDAKAEVFRRKDWKLTRMLIMTFFVYVFSIGPYAIVNIIDNGAQLSENVHVTVSWLLFSNVAVNPFVYGVMNKKFREAYYSLFVKKTRRSLVNKTDH